VLEQDERNAIHGAADILIEEGDTEYAGINTSYDKQLEVLKSDFAGLR